MCANTAFFFFFNNTATTEIYTLSLHDALPIYQRVHRRLPGAEALPRPRRRRRPLGRVRSGVQRAAREGRPKARVARRVEPLLADAPRPQRADRDLRAGRALGDRGLRQSRPRPGARGRPLARAL